MPVRCHMHGCGKFGTKFCGACRIVSYCGVACQQEDWRSHKPLCVKKLPTAILHIDEVSKSVKKSFDQAVQLRAEERGAEAISVLEAALAFAEFEFGARVPGESYRTRRNGDRIDNWRVVTMPLCATLMQLTTLFIDLRTQDAFEKALVHAVEARELIEPRRATLECGELDFVLTLFFQTELSLAEIHMEMFELEAAEYHCEQSLAFARQSRGVDSTAFVFEALKRLSNLRRQQCRLPEATTLCEEAYIVVSRMHGPVHSLVQEAAAELIECLTLAGEYAQAEAYSRITYESLIDPLNGIDPQSEGYARGMQQLANLCLCLARQQHEGSSEGSSALIQEAEGLIRRACSIVESLYGPASQNLAICLETFGQVLITRGIFTEETRSVFERVLTIFTGIEVGAAGGGHGTLQALGSMGDYYTALIGTLDGEDRRKACMSAKLVFDSAAALSRAIYGSDEERAMKFVERGRSIELLISPQGSITHAQAEGNCLTDG